MSEYSLLLQKLQNALSITEDFIPVQYGTRCRVFLSQRFVARFREGALDLLTRETEFLKDLDHPLMPKAVWVGEIEGVPAMVEPSPR